MHALPKRGGGATIHSLGPIAFRGSVDGVDYRPLLPMELAGGIVRPGPDATVVAQSVVGGDLLSTIRTSRWVSIRDVRIPCAALTLDEPDRTLFPEPRPSAGEWKVQGRTLRVWSSPGSGESVVVHVETPEAMPLEVVDRQAGLLRVRFTDGTSEIVGWIRQSDVRRTDEWLGLGLEGVGIGGCGRHRGGSDVVQGPALVDEGTPVYAEPGRGHWGWVRGETTLRVLVTRGERWAAIVRVPGLDETCGELDHAWVQASAVEFLAR